MKKYGSALAVLSLLTISACSSGVVDEGSAGNQGASQAAAPADGSEQLGAAEEYFEAFATQDSDFMAEAAKGAADGSTAEAYMVHQSNIVTALDANGWPQSEETATIKDGKAEVCGDDYCTEYADFQFQDGKISSFTVDGQTIDERLYIGDGEAVKYDDLVSFEVISAYQSASDDLFAVVKFQSFDRPIDVGYTAQYRDQSGRQVDDQDSYLPSELPPNTNQVGVAMFPASEVGGELFLKFATDDDRPLVVETVEVPLVD